MRQWTRSLSRGRGDTRGVTRGDTGGETSADGDDGCDVVDEEDLSTWKGRAAVVAEVASDGKTVQPELYLLDRGVDESCQHARTSSAVIVESAAVPYTAADQIVVTVDAEVHPPTPQEDGDGSASASISDADDDDDTDADADADANDDDPNDAPAAAAIMAESLGVSVPSVAITSLTSCVALLIAGTTEVPALRSFCITAGVGIIVTLVPVVTVFPSVLLLTHGMQGGAAKGHQRTRHSSPPPPPHPHPHLPSSHPSSLPARRSSTSSPRGSTIHSPHARIGLNPSELSVTSLTTNS